MSALNFPSSPSNGDTYQDYVYDSTLGVWQRNAEFDRTNFTVSATQPSEAENGDVWLDSNTGLTYLYYVDVDSSQWIEFGRTVVGPQGPPGPQGIQGIQGPTGDVSTIDSASDVTISSAVSGDALVFDGSVWKNQPRPGRNLFYNGAMQVHQRGTTVTGITSGGYYTADRFNIVPISLGTWTSTIENDGPTGSGFRKSLKILCTAADAAPADGDLLVIQQKLEGQNVQIIRKGTSSAQQLTLSFWTKSNVTGTYIAELFDSNNNRQISASYNISASGTWEKKTITFPADVVGVLVNSNAESITLNLALASGSGRSSGTLNTVWNSVVNANRLVGQVNLAAATNNYWQITGVQLEVGPVATPFEFKPYAQELQECQRYYFPIKNVIVDDIFLVRTTIPINTYYGTISLPVQPRVQSSSIFSYTIASEANTIHKPGVIWDTISTLSLSYYNQRLVLALIPGTDNNNVYSVTLHGVYLFMNAEL
jgi:hypothetical protein